MIRQRYLLALQCSLVEADCCGAEEETTPSPQQWVLEEKLTEDFQNITNRELESGGGPSFAVFKYLCYSATASSKKAFMRIYF
ncbi:hypothetical protein DTO013E5_9939 [Penicillium roqueforti]|uniref:uncharacterized protein n=1 Tax=Penicillium roqueforti TaxID=5082 RepID=UPI00190A5F54|nr:uncharacterized protein LCP9604111_9655 [Penicillium roqueforti]KAF9237807.1 hypothetical protein LCP9604111_9655 [Penicillium roqueforti]KAI1829319.1 hypothetical protein CBS147337_9878 [Penicillium roqueforti]KAI2676111.1 hypothetical protein CBS147355_6292 [Penicillium roqueforti]KAI2684175.1 hypothetical protein LCP963914a_5475 [Penicillium roqueforti]KAI2694649.1 hypothetical protein CBS147372_9679 [Penicillium roqueforti]